jgi:hypothetical protein
VSAIRGLFEDAFPKKKSLNCTIPEFVKSKVGSFFNTNGAEGTMV